MKTKKLTTLAMISAVAMILSYVEAQLPSLGIPGVKMGLANIAVLFALYVFRFREAAVVSMIRVAVVSLLFSGPAAFFYSLAGAVCSICVMILLKKTKKFSPVGVSLGGGVAHNLGQIGVAMLVLETPSLLYYLPVLLLAGLGSGILVGLCGGLLLKRLPLLYRE